MHSNELSPNFKIDDFLMIKSHAKKQRKQQYMWKGPMCKTNATSKHIFEVENLLETKKGGCACAKIVSYPVSGDIGEPSKNLKEQAPYLDSTLPLGQELTGLRKKDNSKEVKTRYIVFDDNEDQRTGSCLPWSRWMFWGCLNTSCILQETETWNEKFSTIISDDEYRIPQNSIHGTLK